MKTAATIEDVKKFWEENPLFVGESDSPVGSKEFFEEHRMVYTQDVFAGQLDARLFPNAKNCERVLDLGCGPGFWTIELAQRGARNITAVDLTEAAIVLAKQRCREYKVDAEFGIENAEQLSFPDASFSHVNCNGVIHHTPNSEACVREIARVLTPGGSALISVYYKNVYLRLWPISKPFRWIFGKFGAGLRGRGREKLLFAKDSAEIVQLFDGIGNPIGKAFSKKRFVEMLETHLQVESIYYHFFPARSLPFRIPKWLHRFLDRNTGFMIFATLKKAEAGPRSSK